MTGPKKSVEDKFTGRLRLAGGVLLLLVGAFISIAPIFNLDIFRAEYKPDPLVLGTIIGGGLLLLGVETANRLPGFIVKKDDEKDKEK